MEELCPRLGPRRHDRDLLLRAGSASVGSAGSGATILADRHPLAFGCAEGYCSRTPGAK
jgi:hypothetical protein